MDERLAQILGSRVAGGGVPGDFLGGTEMPDGLGMFDRQVRERLLIVARRVAAIGHHGGDKRVGIGHRRIRLVHERPAAHR